MLQFTTVGVCACYWIYLSPCGIVRVGRAIAVHHMVVHVSICILDTFNPGEKAAVLDLQTVGVDEVARSFVQAAVDNLSPRTADGRSAIYFGVKMITMKRGRAAITTTGVCATV